MKRLPILVALVGLAWPALADGFKVEVPAFADGVLKPAQFAAVMGCTGGNMSPDIHWSGAPEGTKSFVVTLYDKDAPTGSGFWHWVVVDIPHDATSLREGAGNDGATLPAGARMTNTDMSTPGFLGACPPPGETHDYVITVKALDIAKLDLPDNASPALVGFVSNMNKLAEASVVARGGR
jgi:Raf kinase inhibitor-like YbhB/YbcL family protein